MLHKDIEKTLGALGPLFTDPEIIEIMVDGPNRVSAEYAGGKVKDMDISFSSDSEVITIIRDTLAIVGIDMDKTRTIYETQLTEDSRLVAVLPPTSLTGPNLVIRKWFVNEVLTWDKLLHYQSISPEMRDLIQSAMDAQVNLLVAGGTASGKTTLANRIVDLLAPDKRIIAVEWAHEFHFTHERAVYLEAGGKENISMKDLLDAASKLRPDLLAVGELHDASVTPTLQVFANGHFGLATMHATSVENALSRLETMCLMKNPGLGLDNIREMIASAFQLVTYQELLPTGKRKITQIVELCGVQDGRYVLQPLARYDPEQDAFEMTGVEPGWKN